MDLTVNTSAAARVALSPEVIRPIGPADVDCTVRALMAAPKYGRSQLAQRILEMAMIADEYRARTGKWHPRFGNGSLEGAARTQPMVARASRQYGSRELIEAHRDVMDIAQTALKFAEIDSLYQLRLREARAKHGETL